jgi:RimJ/RimL family protein N-acetyltransferase
MLPVRIRPWGKGDYHLLEKLLGDPTMTEHLGGPESPEKLAERHEKYLRSSHTGEGPMFVIVVGDQETAAGSIGYWEREWRGQRVLETGWSVLPEFQGKGIATRAARLIVKKAKAELHEGYLHAFPSVANGPSNRICQKTGFKLMGQVDFEFPPGHPMRCNDWGLDLGE